MSNLWLAFITGLTSGGVSCFAVQGGLLTTAIATDEEVEITKNMRAKALGIFLIAKLIAYTLLGFMLGFLGSSLSISPYFQGVLQILIGIYMLGTAGRLLNIHPIFRYFVITPPKFILRFLRKLSISGSALTPFFLGFLTVLIPCGVTQAMMLLAIGTASAFWGAGIMFFFILGSSPVFFAIGYAATELMKNKAFNTVAAIVITIIGLISINSGQVLRGSVHTFQNYKNAILDSTKNMSLARVIGGAQEVNITVTNTGYKSDVNTLKVGVPVKITLNTNNVKGCTRAFTIPGLNISQLLPETGTKTVEFTPQKVGVLSYTCSMGMYSGTFKVVE